MTDANVFQVTRFTVRVVADAKVSQTARLILTPGSTLKALQAVRLVLRNTSSAGRTVYLNQCVRMLVVSYPPTTIRAAAATLSAQGSISANATKALAANCIMHGEGSLSANAIKSKAIAATLTGTGSISANPMIVEILRGDGTLQCHASVLTPPTGKIGSGIFRMPSKVYNMIPQKHFGTFFYQTLLQGTGTIVADATGAPGTYGVSAILNGKGAVKGKIKLTRLAASMIAATGTIAANAIIV